MTTARRLAKLGALLTAACVATACGSFGSAEDDPAADASVPETGPSEGGPPPAALDGGTPDACSKLSANEDFNDGLDLSWNTLGKGTVTPTSEGETEFLRAVVQASPELAYLERNLEGCGEIVTVKTRLRVAQEGDGEVDLFRLQLGSGGVLGFIHDPNKGFMSEAPDHSRSPLLIPLHEWIDVSIEVDLAAGKFSMEADGNHAHGDIALPAPPLDEISLQVGISYAGAVNSRWQVDFDDVAISTGPN